MISTYFQHLLLSLTFLIFIPQIHGETNPALTELQKLTRTEHRNLLDDWRSAYHAYLRSIENKPDLDAESRSNIDIIRQLIDLPPLDIPSPTTLTGSWKMRSLQLSSTGIYIYGYFSGKITPQKNSTLQFHKNTGSQRKFGHLAPLNHNTYLFLGASYYQYEDSRDYSSRLTNPNSEDLQRDSVAHLYRIGKNHYLMVFSSDSDRFELYEIRK